MNLTTSLSMFQKFKAWIIKHLSAHETVDDSADFKRPAVDFEQGDIQNVVPYDENLLERSRTQWQFGDWESLAKLERDTLQHHPDRAKLALLTAAGHLQQGNSQEARQFTRLARDWGCNEDLIRQILISGVHNTLGLAAAASEQAQRSVTHFRSSIQIGAANGDLRLLTQARMGHQISLLGLPPAMMQALLSQNTGHTQQLQPTQQPASLRKRKLFIDCGGHDGCSVIKFKLSNPDFHIISFEGNPELWPFYDELPTKLIKKLVYTYNGIIEFVIDPIDADGSSVVFEKKIDAQNKITNAECQRIQSECIDLSQFIKEQASLYQEIYLKLDVEGAEYEILNQMLETGAIDYLDRLYVEFHWERISYPEAKHKDLVNKVQKILDVENWDADEFSIFKKNKASKKLRQHLLKVIQENCIDKDSRFY